MINEQKKIFIIDDEQVILDSYSIYLKHRGYIVYSFNSAITAIKSLPETLPDLIVTDIIMPEMTGIEFLKRIRKYWNIPVIALSGQSTIEHVSQAVNYGVDLFLLKPFQPEKLTNEINNLLSIKKREQNYLNYNREIKKMQRFADFSYLATGLSHQFNTPIQSISCLLYQMEKSINKLMKNNNLDEETASELKLFKDISLKLKDNFFTVSGVVENLKHFELIDQKKSSPKPLSLNKMIILTLKICNLNDNVSVEYNFNEIDTILGFEEDIVRILVNIISNAANAVVNEQFPKININAYKTEKKQVIRITDNGCGIENDIKENIFKPFFTAKIAGYGVGVGLTIAKTLAINMSGDVYLVSSKKGETVFAVELPYCDC